MTDAVLVPSGPYSITQHFQRHSPVVRDIYDAIVVTARKLGPVVEDPKKTTIHLNRRTAFAGIATRRDSLILTIKSTCDIQSERIFKREQASANRWHLEVKLSNVDEVDAELTDWLKEAYEISA